MPAVTYRNKIWSQFQIPAALFDNLLLYFMMSYTLRNNFLLTLSHIFIGSKFVIIYGNLQECNVPYQ